MTLKDLIDAIAKVAKSEPDVNSVYIGDVYALNQKQDVDYPAMVITQQQHTKIDDDYTDYTLNLIYVDRLLEVKDGKPKQGYEEAKMLVSKEYKDNAVDIESNGKIAVDTVLKYLQENYGITIISNLYNVFNEKFNDVCAGVFSTTTLRCYDGICDTLPTLYTKDDFNTLEVTENGKTYEGAYNKVTANIPYQDKSVTIDGTQTITITPDEGYDALRSVVVTVKQ